MSLAERIRKARNEAGLSQEKFAEKLGTSRRHVIKWENGQHGPGPEYRERLANLTGRPAVYFEEDRPDELERAVQARVDEAARRLVA